MHILPGKIADALGRGELSERSKAALYLVGLLLPPFLAPGAIRNRPADALMLLVTMLLITIVGVWLCYRANRAGDGRNVVERMVCLSPPLWVTTYAAFYLVQLLNMRFGPPPPRPPQTAEEFAAFQAFSDAQSWLALAFMVCYAGFMFALRYYVGRASRQSAAAGRPA